jgi:outer membrane protein assembly factor BamB
MACASIIPVHSRSFGAKSCGWMSLAFMAVFAAGGIGGCRPEVTAVGQPVVAKSAAVLAGSDWPVFRGNAQATGVAESSLPDRPELLWKYAVDKGAFEATPVVVGDTVYIGDLDGVFYALDLKSGDERWKFNNPADKMGFNTAAAVRDGRVYIGDIDGNFYCLDAKTGEKKWSAKAEGEINSAANFHGDHVLFGSQDATLYCLDAKTGEERWKHRIGDQIRCSPTVIQDHCFLAGCDGKLHVIDLANGEETGSIEIESPTGSTPAATGELIYFGTEGSTFFCLDWKQPKEIWRWQDKVRRLPIRSSAAVNTEAVVFGGHDKMVHARNPKNGDVLWDFTSKGRIDGSPVIVGNRVFIGSADGRVYGLDLKTGNKVWEYEAGGSFIGSPAVSQGRLLIANSDGVVYCFGEKK